MGGFYGGPSSGSSSSSSSGSNYSGGCYYRYSNRNHPPIPGIILGALILLIAYPAIIITMVHSDVEMKLRVALTLVLLTIFTVPGVFLIVYNVKRYKRMKALIHDALDINKEEIDKLNGAINNSKVYTKTVEPKSNRIITRISRIFGYIFIVAGIVSYILCHQVSVGATITSKEESFRTVDYTFTYTYKGNTYEGSGSDDLKFSSLIEEGKEYTIYVTMVNPKDYGFGVNLADFLFLILFAHIGAGLLIYGFVARKKYLVAIRFVGDLNNDGIIDEKDYEIYKKNNKIDVEFDATKDKFKYCPYCGERLVNQSYCGVCHKKIKG